MDQWLENIYCKIYTVSILHVYKKSVCVFESHYLAGGCAHSFQRDGHTFESGPTILLGCSRPPFNPLRQVLEVCGLSVDWLPYQSWGIIGDGEPWDLQLGLTGFRDHLISTERTLALTEFDELRRITLGLAESASKIPAMAMRSDSNPVPLFIRHLPELLGLLSQPDQGMGPFAPYMNGPIFTVTDPWLRSWLDALAFSLSGVEAAETPASAMAYVLFDMHRQGGTLDYPKGGVGSIVDELVRGVGGVELSRKVDEIVLDEEGRRVKGVRVRGELVSAKEGVICNAAIWELPGLLEGQKKTEELHRFLEVAKDTPFTRSDCRLPPMTFHIVVFDVCDSNTVLPLRRSYLHLHVVLNSTGLDVSSLRPHYTVFDKGLVGDSDHVVGDSNMIAVSNPCVLDPDLSEKGTIMLHAYCCGNEDYTIWENWQGGGDRAGYEALKRERAECLWRR